MESSTIDAPTNSDAIEETRDAIVDAAADVRSSAEEAGGGEHYADELAKAREAEGLDPTSALPEAADASGRDVDLSEGLELQLPGLEGGLKLSFQGIGGKKPEESELRLVGGAFKVVGQFEKGQDVYVEVRGRVTEVAFADVLDNKTAQATTSKRKHKARVLGAVVIEESAREKLEDLVLAVQGHLAGTVSDSVLAALVGGDGE